LPVQRAAPAIITAPDGPRTQAQNPTHRHARDRVASGDSPDLHQLQRLDSRTYSLAATGRLNARGVVNDSVKKSGDELTFRVRDRAATADSGSIVVHYTGTVPDPFKEGREVIVTGKVAGGEMQAQPNSLITKCPSKFANTTGSGASGPAAKY
jgi:hypothetical protein